MDEQRRHDLFRKTAHYPSFDQAERTLLRRKGANGPGIGGNPSK